MWEGILYNVVVIFSGEKNEFRKMSWKFTHPLFFGGWGGGEIYVYWTKMYALRLVVEISSAYLFYILVVLSSY
jgi:hypothetical protein